MAQPNTMAAAGSRVRRPDLATALTILAGVMMTTGLPPFPWTAPVVVAALTLLFALLLAAEHPARRGWYFGLAHQATLLYWLFWLDPAKSIPTRLLVPVQAIAAILYVSLFYLLFGWTLGRVRRWLGRPGALALAPVLWVAMEALRGWGELGFPWCLSGSAWLGTPVRVLAAASGEIGLSAGTALLAAALVWSLHLRHAVRDGGGPARALPLLALLAWVLLAAVTAVWGGPDGPERPARPAAGEPDPAAAAALRVAAVQADVALADKWDPARLDSTRIPYAKLTAAAAAAGAELVVWAETAIPAYVRLDPNLMGWLREQARVNSVWIYTGFPDAERSVPDGEILRYNSSGLVSPEGQLVARYAKHHLLPIGERMPFSDALPFLGRIDVGQAEWRSGDPSQPLPLVANGRSFPFAGLICFEAIFPQLARQAVRRGARALVNITNDGWFGHSVGPRQHAELARMRGIECGVPVVRSANNGISFVSDARGRILDRLDLGRRGYVFAEILPGGGSPFVRWGARPLAAGLLLWALAAAVWARRRGAAA